MARWGEGVFLGMTAIGANKVDGLQLKQRGRFSCVASTLKATL